MHFRFKLVTHIFLNFLTKENTTCKTASISVFEKILCTQDINKLIIIIIEQTWTIFREPNWKSYWRHLEFAQSVLLSCRRVTTSLVLLSSRGIGRLGFWKLGTGRLSSRELGSGGWLGPGRRSSRELGSGGWLGPGRLSSRELGSGGWLRHVRLSSREVGSGRLLSPTRQVAGHPIAGVSRSFPSSFLIAHLSQDRTQLSKT